MTELALLRDLILSMRYGLLVVWLLVIGTGLLIVLAEWAYTEWQDSRVTEPDEQEAMFSAFERTMVERFREAEGQ